MELAHRISFNYENFSSAKSKNDELKIMISDVKGEIQKIKSRPLFDIEIS